MGELLGKAAEIIRATQALNAQELARQTRLAEENEAKRAVSERRAAEFIGVALEHGLPKLPLYQRYYVRGLRGDSYSTVPRGPRNEDRTLRYDHIGDGWVVRPWRYSYEESTVPGIFLTESGQAHLCREVAEVPPRDATPEEAEAMSRNGYVLTDYDRATADITYPRDPANGSGGYFAGDNGLALLGSALVQYGVNG